MQQSFKIEFVANNRKVKIDLNPGLYVFDSNAATGKTLLSKMIKSVGDEKKLAVTYHDILMGLDLERVIEKQPELLVLDRFDLYDGHIEVLEKLKKMDCVTLVDYKTQRNFCDFDDTCFIALTEECLEVSL